MLRLIAINFFLIARLIAIKKINRSAALVNILIVSKKN